MKVGKSCLRRGPAHLQDSREPGGSCHWPAQALNPLFSLSLVLFWGLFSTSAPVPHKWLPHFHTSSDISIFWHKVVQHQSFHFQVQLKCLMGTKIGQKVDWEERWCRALDLTTSLPEVSSDTNKYSLDSRWHWQDTELGKYISAQKLNFCLFADQQLH